MRISSPSKKVPALTIHQPKTKTNPLVARNFCFGCGGDNPQGMRLKFSVGSSDSIVRGVFTLAHRYTGPPSFAHGGIIATLLEEAMGKLNRVDGVVAMTAEMSVEYLKPVPLGRKIIVEARPSEQRDRDYWRESTIRDSRGRLLARGKARFVRVDTKKSVPPKRSSRFHGSK
jgi:uncharacterized protein (TIGR00369 family)